MGRLLRLGTWSRLSEKAVQQHAAERKDPFTSKSGEIVVKYISLSDINYPAVGTQFIQTELVTLPFSELERDSSLTCPVILHPSRLAGFDRPT